MTVGQNSYGCYKDMEEQKKLISKQTNDIENINSELKMELYALENDKAVIASYAHKLDYVAQDEKLVKVNGLKPYQSTLYDVGTVLRHEDPAFLSEEICKIISFFAGFLFLVILFMYDISKGNISFKKKPVVKGIPVYDLPQI